MNQFCDAMLSESSVYAVLRRQGHWLFPDEMFADLFSERGQSSVPPSVVATVMVLQRLEGWSDREAVEHYAFDARWRHAAGRAATTPAGGVGSRTRCWWTCAHGWRRQTIPAGSSPRRWTRRRRRAEIGAAPSIGSVGDPIDNAIAESTIGLFKTELIRRQGPWRGLEDLELATLGWVDWFNHRRLHGERDHIPPAEAEATHYRSRAAPIRV